MKTDSFHSREHEVFNPIAQPSCTTYGGCAVSDQKSYYINMHNCNINYVDYWDGEKFLK